MSNVVSPVNQTKRPRWMIVDDDHAVLALLQKVAARVGDVEIECFGAAQDALAAFEAEPRAFQFVITDLDMPEMNGIELCGWLRAMAPELKVLLVTANESFTDEEIARKGFCGKVNKPFSIAGLESALVSAGVSNLRHTPALAARA